MSIEHLLITDSLQKTWHAGELITSAVLGKNGLTQNKCEGDMCTPVGTFQLVSLYYRPDRVEKPNTGLPTIAITPEMGWCDEPSHPMYNKPVNLPFEASHEKLWFDAPMYDLMITTSHNQHPIIPDRGSAIFIHLLGKNPYTEGCLAMDKTWLLKLAEQATPQSTWHIEVNDAH